ncbi:MAG: hypothetical protein AB8C84_09890 [Oligoflexales bacterium]
MHFAKKKNRVFRPLHLLVVVFVSCSSFIAYSQRFCDLSALVVYYTGKKLHKLRQSEVDKAYDAACEDWHQVCLSSLKRPNKSLPYVEVESDGVEYRLFGYTHGMAQLQAGAYENFIKKAFQSEVKLLNKKIKGQYGLDAIFTEENLTRDLLSSRIKLDHGVILEVADHIIQQEALLKKAAFKALRPSKKNERVRPRVSSVTSHIAMNGLVYSGTPDQSPTYSEYEEVEKLEKKEVWSIPTKFSGDFDDTALQATNEAQLLESQLLDVQLGLSYELPSHLQMEYELRHWKQQQQKVAHFGEFVSTDIHFERSLFMAGVLKGYASYHQHKKISFFMGGWHLKHVYQIMLDDEEVQKSWPYLLGKDLFDSSNVKQTCKNISGKKRKSDPSGLEDKKS